MLDSAEVSWDIDTAGSGAEALELLANEPADVIVYDMKMPGMDGAELLSEVRRLYPATVRIVLSGQADKDAVYRAVTPMHQYLSKPCEAEKLRETIARSCSLIEILESTGSNEIIGRISSLPSLPDIYQKVVAESRSETGTVAKVGELIAQDPAMMAKILQLANSAIFGLRSQVTSPAQAAVVIGMDTLKSLVLSMSVFKSFNNVKFSGFDLNETVQHSLDVGARARHIAKTENLSKEIAGEVFTAGMLHDVGKLVLASFAKEEFSAALAKSKAERIPLVEAETIVSGIGHDGIGALLLSLWGLPQSIVEGVAFHHSPQHCDGDEISTPAIVYIANHLSKSQHEPDQQSRFDDFIANMGLSDRVEIWSESLDT